MTLLLGTKINHFFISQSDTIYAYSETVQQFPMNRVLHFFYRLRFIYLCIWIQYYKLDLFLLRLKQWMEIS